MEVGVRVDVEDMRLRTRRYVTKAYLTFVAVDEHGRPRSIGELTLVSADDIRRHADAEQRRTARLRAAGREKETR
jgi:acyl-CoA hydrolase